MDILGNRYQLQDPIGRGSSSNLYRGWDLHMDRIVAIKVLREVYSTDPKFVKLFQTLAKSMSSLYHPHIVRVYDYGQANGNYYTVMELLEGTDLRRYLRSRGILAVDRAVTIAHGVALGLGEMHDRGMIYRDVSLQKVLVGREGSIKLACMGIGISVTPQYRAPEYLQGEIITPATDVYALGIIMYEMLAGRIPFDGDNAVTVAMQHIQDLPIPPRRFNPNIPPALEEIILRCLEKETKMRFHDGSQLAQALEALSGSET
jgi:eukaryotic-like serine/threonine-protein kinase